MSVFQDSLKWLCGNLAILTAALALFLVAQPSAIPVNAQAPPIGLCLGSPAGCLGTAMAPCNNCSNPGIACPLNPGIGHCMKVAAPVGCQCK